MACGGNDSDSCGRICQTPSRQHAVPRHSDFPELVSRARHCLQLPGNGDIDSGCSPGAVRSGAGEGGPADLGRVSDRMDGANLFAYSNGIFANYLYIIYTDRLPGTGSDLDAGTRRRVPLHGVPDHAGFSYFVCRLSDGSRARTPVFTGSRATCAASGALVLPDHAGHTQPTRARTLRLLSERPHRDHGTGLLAEPGDFAEGIWGLFFIHSLHRFCYSLSTVSLHRRPSRWCAGCGCSDSCGATFVPRTI